MVQYEAVPKETQNNNEAELKQSMWTHLSDLGVK